MNIKTAIGGIAVLMALCAVSMQVKYSRTQTTANFRLRAERNVSDAMLRSAGNQLERAYKEYSAALKVTFAGKMNAYIFRSEAQCRAASQSLAFGDGDYRNGKLYLALVRGKAKDSLFEHAADRIVVRALLDRFPACPQWLAEAYALWMGRALDRYGRPASVTVSSFSDLGEDYFHAEDEQQAREVYSKLAITMKFLLSRYGDDAVRDAILKFRSGASLEESFEGTFKEKLPDIEKAWVQELRRQSKG